MNYQITLTIIGIALLLAIGYLTWLLRVVLLKKELLATIPTRNDKAGIPLPSKNNPFSTKPKYVNSGLSAEDKERYLNQLLSYIEKEKPYLQSNLTIAQLAKLVQMPKHYLSQVINEKLGCSFLDFINQCRITEAKEKLQNPALKGFTLVQIGQKVGFKARSTFYTAFKKYTQQTPAEFRKRASMKKP